MSLKKPIIEVTRECSYCGGSGNRVQKGKYNCDTGNISRAENPFVIVNCKKCRGLGRVSVERNNKNFKKYYIKNLEQVVEYWTMLYREKNRAAQEHLKEVRKYCEELDKVVNK